MDERQFAGTFNGVPGKYACTVQTCTATANKEGVLIDLTGAWTFSPDTAPEGSPYKVFGVIPDTDHIRFGYWLETTPAADEDPITYAFQAFMGGVDGEYAMGNTIEVWPSTMAVRPATMCGRN